jgi:hypothetical protein
MASQSKLGGREASHHSFVAGSIAGYLISLIFEEQNPVNVQVRKHFID